MKLVTYVRDKETKLGIRTDGGVVDVAAAQRAFRPAGAAPATVLEAMERGEDAIGLLKALAEEAASSGASECLLDEAALPYAPCVPRPGKIICVGLNYRKHAMETNAPIPSSPILFNKFSNALAAHGETIRLPKASREVDYEAELAIVIGKRAKDVSREDALNYVFGYCNANDLSARDLQNRTTQWMLGKTCDGFAPLGPWLVTADEVGDPNRLAIRCTVNGHVRQSSNTSDMIFPCDELVSYISRHMTLEPGDVILTGTPEGVVLGLPKEERVYLRDGDVVTVEVEKLGALTNRLEAEG